MDSKLTPNLKEVFPEIEQQLAGASDDPWKQVFLRAGAPHDLHPRHPRVTPRDLEVLAPRAARASHSNDERIRTISILERNWVRSANAEITAWLSDSDDALSYCAALALQNLDVRDAVPAFQQLLEHPVADRRCEAAKAMGNLGGPAGPLIARLQDSSGDVREAAAAALGNLRAAEATPDLLRLIWNPDTGRLDEVFTALGKIGDPSTVPELRRHAEGKRGDLRRAAVGALALMRSPEAMPYASTLLNEPAPNTRIQALVMFGSMRTREALPYIEARLSDPDEAVRGWAAKAMVLSGAWDKADSIARLLRDRESYVRGIAAECLGQLEARQHVGMIAKLLGDELTGTRSRAIRALGALGASDHLKKIRSFLGAEETSLRVSAIRAITQLRAKGTWSEVARLLRDAEWEVRQAAVTAGENLADEKELSGLTLLLADPHPLVKMATATTFVHRRDRSGVPLLLREYRDRRWPIPSESGPVYEGKTLRSLNALRQPDLYRRLRETPMELPSGSNRRELVARLARSSEKTVDWSGGADDSTLSTRWEWDGGMRPSILDGLTALLQGSCEDGRSPRYEFILENDRIRILPGYDALIFWEEWGGRGEG